MLKNNNFMQESFLLAAFSINLLENVFVLTALGTPDVFSLYEEQCSHLWIDSPAGRVCFLWHPSFGIEWLAGSSERECIWKDAP